MATTLKDKKLLSEEQRDEFEKRLNAALSNETKEVLSGKDESDAEKRVQRNWGATNIGIARELGNVLRRNPEKPKAKPN